MIATWWVGLPIGFLLASASTVGRREPLEVRTVLGLIGRLLAIMAVCATVLGCIGYTLADRGLLELPEALAAAVPVDRHARFVAAWWAHSASYGAGIVGSLILVAVAWRKRRPAVGRLSAGR